MVKAEEMVEKPSKDGSIVPVVKEEDTDKFPLRKNFQTIMIHKEKR